MEIQVRVAYELLSAEGGNTLKLVLWLASVQTQASLSAIL